MHVIDPDHPDGEVGELGTWSSPRRDWPYDPDPDDGWRHPDLVSTLAAPYEASPVRLTDRLTHMVLVDGRLVEFWTEPVEGTRWAHHADALDRHVERLTTRAGTVARQGTLAPYDAVLAWLEAIVGGPLALESLTATPLSPCGQEDPLRVDRARDQQRVDRVLEHLTEVAEAWFDDEVDLALRRALRRLLAHAPDLVLGAKSAGLAAGGVCWAVGRANDLIGADRPARATDLQRLLGTSALGQRGGQVARALYGLRRPVPPRPHDCPDLVALGHADLLTSSLRSRLLQWRNRAQETRTLYAPLTREQRTVD